MNEVMSSAALEFMRTSGVATGSRRRPPAA
jgi:hypothetical protein